jgi:hypothetical protein
VLCYCVTSCCAVAKGCWLSQAMACVAVMLPTFQRQRTTTILTRTNLPPPLFAAAAAAAAVQTVDLDTLALVVQCPIPPVQATNQELNEAEGLARNGPQSAVASDGSGLSSRPGAPYRLWLDFAGSTITGSGATQQCIICCSRVTLSSPCIRGACSGKQRMIGCCTRLRRVCSWTKPAHCNAL